MSAVPAPPGGARAGALVIPEGELIVRFQSGEALKKAARGNAAPPTSDEPIPTVIRALASGVADVALGQHMVLFKRRIPEQFGLNPQTGEPFHAPVRIQVGILTPQVLCYWV